MVLHDPRKGWAKGWPKGLKQSPERVGIMIIVRKNNGLVW